MSEQALEPVVLLLSSASFAGAFTLWLRHAQKQTVPAPAPAASSGPASSWSFRLAIVTGLLLAGGLLAWQIIQKHGLKVDNHIEVFLLLGLLLALMAGYFRLTNHLRRLGVFLLPMIAVVLLVGGLLAFLDPGRRYDYTSMLTVVHVLAIAAGSVCFAAGCVSGVVYLLADGRLRRKGDALAGPTLLLPPLATLEKVITYMVYLGFPLLTVAMITGFMRVWQALKQPGENLDTLKPKVVLAVLAWLVYAFLIHVHFAPAFRGRKAAWLSIIGFILLLGVYLTVNQVRLH